jgi:hypothetical protein
MEIMGIMDGSWYYRNGNQLPYDPELAKLLPKISWNIVSAVTLPAINSSSRS